MFIRECHIKEHANMQMNFEASPFFFVRSIRFMTPLITIMTNY